MENCKGLTIKYARKIFRKTNISSPVTRTRACYGVRNVSFSENFAYVLNGWPIRQLYFIIYETEMFRNSVI